jgi:hypothetical protein
MANTHLLKTKVEPFVREWLCAQFGIPFRAGFLRLHECEGSHEFDAISVDNRIVAGIKSSSGKTSGGRIPSGKISSAFEELYYLSRVDAEQKILVLTDQEFFNLMMSKTNGKLPADIRVVYCPLSPELEEIAKSIRRDASDEIDVGKPTLRKGSRFA